VNFYWRFIWDFSAKAWPLWPNTLWASLDVERKRAGSLWGPQNSGDHHSGVNVPLGLGALLNWSEQLGLCYRSSLVSAVGDRWKMAPRGVLQQVPVLCGMKLWDLWQGDTSYYSHIRRVEVLSRRSNLSGRNLDQPQEPQVFHDGERSKRDIYCNKQVGKVVTVLNCMLKGLWGEGGSGSIRKKLKSEYTAYLESKYRRNDGSCKGDWTQDSRRILSNITDCGYSTTHLQENPQRLGWGSWRDPLHYIHPLVSGLAGSELN